MENTIPVKWGFDWWVVGVIICCAICFAFVTWILTKSTVRDRLKSIKRKIGNHWQKIWTAGGMIMMFVGAILHDELGIKSSIVKLFVGLGATMFVSGVVTSLIVQENKDKKGD